MVATVEQGRVRCEVDGCRWSHEFQVNGDGKIKRKSVLRETFSSHLMMEHGYSRDDGWKIAKSVS